MTALTYDDEHELYRLIRAAVMGTSPLQAVDPEKLSALVSWGRPNPRRIPTVRRTGSEGKRRPRDPPDVMAQARMRRLLGELEERKPKAAAFVRGAAFGVRQSTTAETLRRMGVKFDQREIPGLVEQGQAWLWERWGGT